VVWLFLILFVRTLWVTPCQSFSQLLPWISMQGYITPPLHLFLIVAFFLFRFCPVFVLVWNVDNLSTFPLFCIVPSLYISGLTGCLFVPLPPWSSYSPGFFLFWATAPLVFTFYVLIFGLASFRGFFLCFFFFRGAWWSFTHFVSNSSPGFRFESLSLIPLYNMVVFGIFTLRDLAIPPFFLIDVYPYRFQL